MPFEEQKMTLLLGSENKIELHQLHKVIHDLDDLSRTTYSSPYKNVSGSRNGMANLFSMEDRSDHKNIESTREAFSRALEKTYHTLYLYSENLQDKHTKESILIRILMVIFDFFSTLVISIIDCLTLLLTWLLS
jgi:hypothetical protein